MREIKFRGKQLDNGEWVYGSLIVLTTGYYIVPTDTYYNTIDVDLGEKITINALWEHNDFYEVIPETVGQYIGLHDKNGREIYEGDILIQSFIDENGATNSSRPLVVKYIESQFVAEDIISGRLFGLWKEINYDIIGNMYSNPELLKESD